MIKYRHNYKHIKAKPDRPGRKKKTPTVVGTEDRERRDRLFNENVGKSLSVDEFKIIMERKPDTKVFYHEHTYTLPKKQVCTKKAAVELFMHELGYDIDFNDADHIFKAYGRMLIKILQGGYDVSIPHVGRFHLRMYSPAIKIAEDGSINIYKRRPVIYFKTARFIDYALINKYPITCMGKKTLFKHDDENLKFFDPYQED
jgi:nucleoid DNA-binding protein